MANMNQAVCRTALTLAALLASTAALAETQAVTPYADIRYRLELVDQDGLAEEAAASTLRVRAGVKTAEWQGFSAVVEGEAIAVLGQLRLRRTTGEFGGTRIDDLAEGTQQRFERSAVLGTIAAGPVGNTDHADHMFAVSHGQPEKARQRRVPGR